MFYPRLLIPIVTLPLHCHTSVLCVIANRPTRQIYVLSIKLSDSVLSLAYSTPIILKNTCFLLLSFWPLVNLIIAVCNIHGLFCHFFSRPIWRRLVHYYFLQNTSLLPYPRFYINIKVSPEYLYQTVSDGKRSKLVGRVNHLDLQMNQFPSNSVYKEDI